MKLRPQPREELDAACRSSLLPFSWRFFSVYAGGEAFTYNWHLGLICDALEQALSGRRKRVLITMPPRYLKSFMASVALVAYMLGKNPSAKVMVASYGGDLAAKFGRDTLRIMRSPAYRRLFPETLISPGRATPLDFQTTAGGHRLGVGLNGPTTGFGADFLIIDDLVKVVDGFSSERRQQARDYYDQALFSRLNDKSNGSIIVIQQRLHEEDFAAYCIEKGFYHLNLPAIAETDERHVLSDGRVLKRRQGEPLFAAREPLDTLETIRRDIGKAAFNAQYQQNPMQPDENPLRWERFGNYDERLERDQYLYVAQSWDTAFSSSPTADYSVGMTFGLAQDGLWELLDIERARLDYPELKQRVIATARRWRADVVIVEQASSGLALRSELLRERALGSCRFRAMKNFRGKEIRFQQQLDKIERGVVALPVDAPWLAEFRREMLAFPHGRHDDQVDAFTQFLEWTDTRGRKAVTNAFHSARFIAY